MEQIKKTECTLLSYIHGCKYADRRADNAKPNAFAGPVCFNVTVIDQNDGTYLCKYTSILCGDYYVSVRRDGTELPG
jgi:hypothetical protein